MSAQPDLKSHMPSITTRAFFKRAVLLATGLLLAACSKQEPTPPTPVTAPATAPAPARIYTVGTDAAYAPFESQNEKGEIVGFDIDVVRAVAAKAGIEIKLVNTPWEGIFSTLNQGDRDFLVSDITITEERKQSMDFSAAYFDAHQLIAVRDNDNINALADLKNLKIGVQTGTTGDEVATKLVGKNSPNVKRYESTPLALKELEAGGVDAVVADNGVVIHYVANNSGTKFRIVSDQSFTPEQYGFAIKKGNTELQAKLNQGLSAIRADGTYEQIYTKYFGAPAATVATSAAAASSPAK